MSGTGIEKEIEICGTNIANKTKCMSTTALILGTNCEDIVSQYPVPYIQLFTGALLSFL
jgi:hypothetical protein